MKKITALFSAALMLATGVGSLTACSWFKKDEGQKTVMNVSLNPQVEFVLDGNNKVVSVNALNEEGNLIISSEAFKDVEGKTAEEAAKLFVEVSKDTGYLVEGEIRSGENQLKVSLSGDAELATELYNKVATEVNTYLETVDIQATVAQAEAITEEQLKQLVDECAPYLETAEMEYAELLDTLIESRKETSEIYSQEIKNAYYEAKEYAMQQAEIDVMKEKLNMLEEAFFNGITLTYKTNVALIEGVRKAFFIDGYQLALKALQDAKVEYLKKRAEISVDGFNATVEVELSGLDEAVEKAEAALEKAVADGNKALDDYKALISEGYNKAIVKLEEKSVRAEENLPAIAKKRQAVQKDFFDSFEKTYGSAMEKADESWATMEEALRASVKA